MNGLVADKYAPSVRHHGRTVEELADRELRLLNGPLVDFLEDELHALRKSLLLLAPLVLYPLLLRGQETCGGKEERCVDDDKGNRLFSNDNDQDKRDEPVTESVPSLTGKI